MKGYRPPRPRVRESAIQEKVVSYAREKYKGKVIVIKRQAGKYGTNGWPDYEFLINDSEVFHIEFKAPGGQCTDLQLQRHAELRALGHRVYVCDDVAPGKRVVDTEILKRRVA